MVTINLKKLQPLDLSKEAPDVKKIVVSLKWEKGPFDADAMALLLDHNGCIQKSEDVVYYRNKCSGCNAVALSKDSRNGGDGDDEGEEISVDLTKIDSRIKRVNFSISLHDAERNGHKFGMVNGCHVRIINQEDGSVLARYDLDEDFSTSTAVELADLYLKDGKWMLERTGVGHTSIISYLGKHGIDVE